MREVLLIIVLCGIAYAAWSWWREKRSRSGGGANSNSPRQLYRAVLREAKGDHTLVDRLLDHARTKYPGKTEAWYLDKILYDFRRDH